MAEFRMPSLGADMTEGTLLEWRVAPGDTVHKGDIVAVVDTDKSAIEVEIFNDGVIEQLLVAPGTVVPVGTVLATLVPVGAAVPSAPPEPAAAAPPPPPPIVEAPVVEAPLAEAPVVEAPHVCSPVVRHLAERTGVRLEAVRGSGVGGRITRADVEHAARPAGDGHGPSASPFARRLAAERGIDLSTLQGSGPAGAVVASDVESRPVPAAAPAPVAPVAKAGAERMAALRAATAALMARSKREIPHYYLAQDIDLSGAMAWLEERNAERSVAERVLPAALLCKATALAARALPQLNGFWVDGGFRPGDAVHLGVAVSLRGGGLVAPAIHDADTLGLDEMMAALRDLVNRARAGRLKASEMADPTITVSNLGDQGVGSVYAVITPPQVALVGFGRVAERPWAEAGMLGVRPVVTATLAADHRATDGHVGARFLAAVERLLHDPDALWPTAVHGPGGDA